MSKFKNLERRVCQLEKNQISIPCRYSGYYVLNRDNVIKMLIEYLGVEYDSGNIIPPKFIKQKTQKQLKKEAGIET